MKKDPQKDREAANYERPIASREFILSTMQEHGEPIALKQLARKLGLEDSVDQQALRNRLKAMVRDGQLMVDQRNVYAIASRMELIAGKVSAHPDGYGFLVSEDSEDDIFLSHRQMRSVFHGDRALVRVRGKDRRGRVEGEIVEVIERNTEQLVGRFYLEGRLAFIEPLNNRITHEIIVRDEKLDQYQSGQIVVGNIIEQPSFHSLAVAEIAEVLGDHLTPDMEVEIALRNHEIPVNFPDDVIEAVDRIPIEVQEAHKKNRKDLRELSFVTIDGEDARDFDDAVYCESRKGGGWRLFVAIADVAHYIDRGTPLDQAAYERATSVYFPQYVVPMLPEKLSNGLCSLNPEVDRLVVVCEMTISSSGRISGYQFYEGVIKSAARLTYTVVAEIIGKDGDKRERARNDYRHVVRNVDELYSLYDVLTERRAERGTLDFDSTELEFDFDNDGRLAEITPRKRNDAHKLVEECMLCANVCAARFISAHDITGLYRIHEGPEPEKVEYLREFLTSFGITLGGNTIPTPSDYQWVIEQLRDKKNGHVLQIVLLRSLKQAVYQPDNKGHFGLNFREYTHFTSPIRRYPDLLTHRLIKSVIHGSEPSKYVERFGGRSRTDFYPYEDEDVISLGEHCSYAERRAEGAVYDVLEWMKCDYVSDRVGDEFEGVITNATRFGFFVELEDIYVEGLVHVSTLTGDYFHYEEAEQCLVGERSNQCYGIGDAVRVQLARVSVDERKIDFEVISHSPLTGRLKSKKKKTPSKKSSPKARSGSKTGKPRTGKKDKKDKKGPPGRKPRKKR
ncbi:MAG: ribonuclease R [Pseudomonadales bacterium]